VTLVADAGGQVVGNIGVELAPYGVAELGMALLEGWRGQGIGRRLLDEGVAWARSSGAHKMALEAWPDNDRALALYRRAGFVVEGRKRSHYRRRNGERWDAVVMGLALEPAVLRLRPVRDQDGWDLVALIGACWSEYPGCVMDAHGEYPELLVPASAYAAKNGALWVLDAPAGLMASVGLAPGSSAAVIELQKLYVGRPWRRSGLALSLVAHVEGEAANRGAAVVELWSDSRFSDAHRLYEALGYQPSGASRDLHDLSSTVEYHFAKPLSPTL
jgi:GNAT superfamily N-acetyltransferase